MDIYETIGIIIAPIIIIVSVLLITMWSRFFGNNPKWSIRAKSMKKLAQKLGCQFTFDTNTLSERLWKTPRKINVITGEYNGKQIEIYDYNTVTNYSFALGQDPKRFTIINGAYYKQIKAETIEEILNGTLDKERLNKLRKDNSNVE